VATECKQKLKEVAAKSLGGNAEDYEVAGGRVSRRGGGAGLTLAQAAQKAIVLGGIYDGHEAPSDVNKRTKAAVAALAGEDLWSRPRTTIRAMEIHIHLWRALPKWKWTWRRASTT